MIFALGKTGETKGVDKTGALRAPFKRLLHRQDSLIDHGPNGASQFIGKEIGNPDDPTLPVALSENLH